MKFYLINLIVKVYSLGGSLLRPAGGENLFFSIPVEAHLEPGAPGVVSRGDLESRLTGNAFCILPGPPLNKKRPVNQGIIRPAFTGEIW
jgi:hypothetical protein